MYLCISLRLVITISSLINASKMMNEIKYQINKFDIVWQILNIWSFETISLHSLVRLYFLYIFSLYIIEFDLKITIVNKLKKILHETKDFGRYYILMFFTWIVSFNIVNKNCKCKHLVFGVFQGPNKTIKQNYQNELKNMLNELKYFKS